MNIRRFPPAASLLLAFASALLLGCSSQPPKPWVPPSLVLILPPENTTAATDIESIVYPMVYERMVNRGYYCISPELARGIFNTNKLEDAGRINSLPPRKFREVFGADAVLKVRVTEWSSYYMVLASSVSVTMEMSLVDTETGETLWTRTRTESRSPESDSAGTGKPGLVETLVHAMIDAAVHAAITEYEPIAEANVEAMVGEVPAGDYGKAEPGSQASGVETRP